MVSDNGLVCNGKGMIEDVASLSLWDLAFACLANALRWASQWLKVTLYLFGGLTLFGSGLVWKWQCLEVELLGHVNLWGRPCTCAFCSGQGALWFFCV